MSRQWGPCEKHGADLPCPDCQPIVDWDRGGRPLIVRRFTCIPCGDPCDVRQYREGGLSVVHVDWLLAKHQHPPVAS